MPKRDAIPETTSPFEDAGMPETQEPYPGQRATGDVPDEAPVPGDRPRAVDDYGTTANEQGAPEPLRTFVHREQLEATRSRPGADPDDEIGKPVGRLLDPADADVDVTDVEAQAIASDEGLDGGGLSAEEEAVRIERDS